MAIAVATQETTNQAVARPLKVLVPLIKQDMEGLKQSKDKATSPYYLSIGEKLLEAKANPEVETGYGYWGIWLKDNFKYNPTTAANYMGYANRVKFSATAENLTYTEYYKIRKLEAKKQKNPASAHQQKPDPAGQTSATAGDARRADAKLEKEALRTIAIKIIDTGYKVLSKRLHPDVGGDAMDFNRLKTATTQLKELI
jgi:hypothetical protein